MSITVELEALRDELAGRDRPAYVITAGADGGPHLVAVYLRAVDDGFVAPGGRHTVANVTERPDVSVVVPSNEVDGYSLIFDAEATVVDGEERTVHLRPTKAVLHRPAADGDGDHGGHDCQPIG